jgi:hypothetical protein
MALASAVKQLLQSCPSLDPREVMAFQSIKKGLPDSCPCMESELLSDVIRNTVEGSPPVLPPGYLGFVKKQVRALFPKGWDCNYEGFACRTAPPLKGTLESKRSEGGSLGSYSGFHQGDFLKVVLDNETSLTPDRLRGAFQVVQSAGKPRPLTTFSSDGLYLRPLHKTIYSRLSKKSWLLRGDLTDASLRKAGFKMRDGEVLVSGDYKSATDNLSIEVMELILTTLLENAYSVPQNVKDFAVRACRPWLWESREDWEAARTVSEVLGVSPDRGYMELKKGQMMGSFLSFPLLCIQNYLAFRFSTRHHRGKIPVLINGDDILFQSTPQVAHHWLDTVGSLSLEVERSKTSVAESHGSLNSTLVEWAGNYLRVVPTLRFGMLRPVDFPSSLGRSFSEFLKGIVGVERFRAGRVFFDFHLGELKNCSWSLPSLGFRGALAHRLARLYGLVLGRQDGSYPEAPSHNSVCLSRDLISEVPLDFVSSELRDLDAVETAAWKWSTGFVGRDLVSSGVQYAIAATYWRHPLPAAMQLKAFYATDREFEHLLRNSGVEDAPVTRRTGLKGFVEPFPQKTAQRVFWTAAQEFFNFQFAEFGPPPTYDESM